MIVKSLYLKDKYDYITVPALSHVIVILLLKLWNADLLIPLNYSGDILVYSSWIKSIIENGWWLDNKFLGAPFVQNLHDFPYPATATLQILVIKLIGMITHNHWLTLNLYLLITFPLVTMTSIYCLRELGISRHISNAGSLLFTLIPYHFFRGTSHLFASGYYTIPLVVMLSIWLYREDKLFFRGKSVDISRNKLINRKFIAALAISMLLANVGIHFAFFGSFLLLIAGVTGAVKRESGYPLVNAIILLTVIGIFVIGCLTPTIIYKKTHGQNFAVAQRGFLESETYGLRIIQLILPVDDHRLPILDRIKSDYDTGMYSKNDNETSFVTLGIVGTCGFLFLLGWLLWGRWVGFKDDSLRESLNILSVLNGSAVLLGTMGGFGTLFAFLVSPQIRVYNRISIYIAFISLTAVCLLADTFIRRREEKGKKNRWLIPLVCGVVVLGILDQTTTKFIPEYDAIGDRFLNDRQFIASVEAAVPPGSMIFQLPYVPFPENPPVNKMNDYEHLKPYLHSNNLRWSYGAIKGREADRWQQHEASKPTPEFIHDIAVAGFAGIYLDRYGYDDNGQKIVGEIAGIVKTAPLEDSDRRRVFFPLVAYTSSLAREYGIKQLDEMKEGIMHPIYVDWHKGCYDLEKDATRTWRWCQADAEMVLTNGETVDRDVTLAMTVYSFYPEPAHLKINSDLFHQELTITGAGTPVRLTFKVPPGVHSILFSTDARKVNVSTDPRDMYFNISNFSIR